MDTLAAKDVSAFLRRPFDGSRPLGAAMAGSERDRERAYLLLDALVSRAALLAAGVLAAAVLKSGRGALASRPVCVAVDGTTWREVPGLAGRAGGDPRAAPRGGTRPARADRAARARAPDGGRGRGARGHRRARVTQGVAGGCGSSAVCRGSITRKVRASPASGTTAAATKRAG